MKTIDMTPTFAATAKMLIILLERGTDEGKEFARSEIIRWGTMLDTVKVYGPKHVQIDDALDDLPDEL